MWSEPYPLRSPAHEVSPFPRRPADLVRRPPLLVVRPFLTLARLARCSLHVGSKHSPSTGSSSSVNLLTPRYRLSSPRPAGTGRRFGRSPAACILFQCFYRAAEGIDFSRIFHTSFTGWSGTLHNRTAGGDHVSQTGFHSQIRGVSSPPSRFRYRVPAPRIGHGISPPMHGQKSGHPLDRARTMLSGALNREGMGAFPEG